VVNLKNTPIRSITSWTSRGI